MRTAILDYATHQNRLMPLLAGTYAIHFTGMAHTHSLSLSHITIKQLKSEETRFNKTNHGSIRSSDRSNRIDGVDILLLFIFRNEVDATFRGNTR
jgi:hypothetical protein